MITLAGIRNTIADIERNGRDMQDLADLNMLYELEGRMCARDNSWRSDSSGEAMTRENAEHWVAGMKNEDPSKPIGGKWTPEQVKPIAAKYGIPMDGEKFWEFYAVMNAMHSDYYAVAKKYNTMTQEFFADMARAFINDKDSVNSKTRMYYEHIVKK